MTEQAAVVNSVWVFDAKAALLPVTVPPGAAGTEFKPEPRKIKMIQPEQSWYLPRTPCCGAPAWPPWSTPWTPGPSSTARDPRWPGQHIQK